MSTDDLRSIMESKKNVSIGKNPTIGEYVDIGLYPEGLKTVIGDAATIRSHTVIYAGNKIGNDFQTGHGILIRENNVIGNNVSIGSHYSDREGRTIKLR